MHGLPHVTTVLLSRHVTTDTSEVHWPFCTFLEVNVSLRHRQQGSLQLRGSTAVRVRLNRLGVGRHEIRLHRSTIPRTQQTGYYVWGSQVWFTQSRNASLSIRSS